MNINKYDIINTMQILSSTILEKDDAENLTVTIKNMLGSLSFTTSYGINMVVPKLDASEDFGNSITVNMYQLFMTVDNCDEVIDIQADGDKLLINSFYNGECDKYELQVSIVGDSNISHEQIEVKDDEVGRVSISSLILHTIINEFFNFKSNKGILVSCDGKTITMSSSDKGVTTQIIIPDTEVSGENFHTYLPFQFINSAYASDGVSLDGFDIIVYDNYITAKTQHANIIIPNIPYSSSLMEMDILSDDDLRELYTIDSQKLVGVLDKTIQVNKSTPDAKFYMQSYIDIDEVEIVSIAEDKMPIECKVITGATVYEGIKVNIDPSILFNIFNITGTQYIRAYTPLGTEDQLVFKFRNAMFTKYVHYNHTKWMAE